jgi:uncharacterized protein (DUF1684 family)
MMHSQGPPRAEPAEAAASPYLELLDWRRRVSELFAALRQRPADVETLAWFRAEKDVLFRQHPQSPIPVSERASFGGLRYWPYDPSMRVMARFEATAQSGPPSTGEIPFRRIGTLHFDLHGRAQHLAALWIEGYAGGLFVPFLDATCGQETYGGGRYLLDTIKSADLGSDLATSTVVLDFNYAYHPSCAYDPRWVCPLARPSSRLPVAVRAGERLT